MGVAAEIRQQIQTNLETASGFLTIIDKEGSALIKSAVEEAFKQGRLSIKAAAGAIGGPVGAFVGTIVGDVVWTVLPGWVKTPLVDFISVPIIALVKGISDQSHDFITYMDSLVWWVGSPDTLRNAAQTIDAVVPMVSTLGGTMAGTNLKAVQSWNAPPASEKYSYALSQQVLELGRSDNWLETLSSILKEMADSIEDFNLGALISIAAFVVAIIGLYYGLVGLAATIEFGGAGGVPGLIVAVISAIICMASTVYTIQAAESTRRGLAQKADLDTSSGKWSRADFVEP